MIDPNKRYRDKFKQHAGVSWGGPVEMPEVVLNGSGSPIRKGQTYWTYKGGEHFSKEFGPVIEVSVPNENQCFVFTGSQYCERVMVRVLHECFRYTCGDGHVEGGEDAHDACFLFDTKEEAERSMKKRKEEVR